MQLMVLMDDRTQRRRCRPLLTWSAFLVIALSGCQSAAQSRPANDRQAVPEQTPVPTFESGSRRYRECNAAAGDDTRAQGRCLDEELAYQLRVLDGFYQEAAALDPAKRSALRAEQRVWKQETDRRCGTAANAEVHPVEQVCRLERAIAKSDTMIRRLSGATSGHWAEDAPDADGTMEMRLGDALITMRSDGCTHRVATELICSNVHLSISTPALHRQTLLLPEVWLPRTIRQGHPATTGFRGSLHAGFAEGLYGIMLSDINADGHEDLMVWTGPDGTYGDPSYTYYLYDTRTRRLVENTALAELMEGNSLSRIVDGRLFAWYRSGPCDRGEKVIGVRDNIPEILARRDYTTCGEDALEADEIFDDSWMNLQGGNDE